MAGKFEIKYFSQIDLADPFFDTLKKDYPEFAEYWFPKCIQEGRRAWVFSDEKGLAAFIALKEENEQISLEGASLPACPRLKVSTLRLAERFRGQRLGAGIRLNIVDLEATACGGDISYYLSSTRRSYHSSRAFWLYQCGQKRTRRKCLSQIEEIN